MIKVIANNVVMNRIKQKGKMAFLLLPLLQLEYKVNLIGWIM